MEEPEFTPIVKAFRKQPIFAEYRSRRPPNWKWYLCYSESFCPEGLSGVDGTAVYGLFGQQFYFSTRSIVTGGDKVGRGGGRLLTNGD